MQQELSILPFCNKTKMCLLFGLIFCLMPVLGLGQNLTDKTYEELHEAIEGTADKIVGVYIDSLLCNNEMTTFDVGRLNFLKAKLCQIGMEYDKAVIMYRESIKLFKKTNNYEWEVKARLNLSVLYCNQNFFTKAATELYTSQEIVDKTNNTKQKAVVSEFFANMYYRQGDKNQALNYLERAVMEYEAGNDTVVLSRLYNNLAVLYKNKKQFKKAIGYNKKSLALSEYLNDQLAISESYNNIATNYENLYNQTDSIIFLELAISFYEASAKLKRNYPEEWNTALENLARLESKVGQYNIVTKYHDEVLSSGYQKIHLSSQEMMFRRWLSDALRIGHLNRAKQYLTSLDSVQVLLRGVQKKDFQQMLQNQEELFEIRRRTSEHELMLKEEQNTRMLAERAHDRIKVMLIGVLVLVLFALLLFVQYHKNLRYKNEKEKNRLKHKILRSQMNPHFIFNVLTAIQNSILDESPLKSAEYISNFSRLIRQNFDFTNLDTISLYDDLDALVNYMETQKIRYSNKFTYAIHVDDTLDKNEIQIPPMLLQPIVENAIEHGLRRKKEGGKLDIYITPVEKGIRFVVTDNGSGYFPKNEDGKEHSLDVLKARLAISGYGDEQTFIATNLDNTAGTKVEFSITLKSDV